MKKKDLKILPNPYASNLSWSELDNYIGAVVHNNKRSLIQALQKEKNTYSEHELELEKINAVDIKFPRGWDAAIDRCIEIIEKMI